VLIGPEFLARAPESKQWVVLDSVLDAALAPALIPVQQICVLGWNVLSRGDCLGTFPSSVVNVAIAK
jgi:hypothetical protein